MSAISTSETFTPIYLTYETLSIPCLIFCFEEIRQWCFDTKSSDTMPSNLDKLTPAVTSSAQYHISSRKYPMNHCTGYTNNTQDNSSGETRNPLPVSFGFDAAEKGLCFGNPAHLSNYPSCPIRLTVSCMSFWSFFKIVVMIRLKLSKKVLTPKCLLTKPKTVAYDVLGQMVKNKFIRHLTLASYLSKYSKY